MAGPRTTIYKNKDAHPDSTTGINLKFRHLVGNGFARYVHANDLFTMPTYVYLRTEVTTKLVQRDSGML